MGSHLNRITWTNPSVKLFSPDSDPTKQISEVTRELVLKAMDEGWQGPPFDPFWLAEHLGISLIPNDDVLDARFVPKPLGKKEIEYNPNQPQNRVRFSVAHEIAHTLFPDYAQTVRNRTADRTRHDEWQLELLCNISAAEILMPTGPRLDLGKVPVTMETALTLREKFEVSMEAILLRLVKQTQEPVTIFVAAREEDRPNTTLRIDYSVPSATSNVELSPGFRIPRDSSINECTAVGYTGGGREKWSKELSEMHVEWVGVPPYERDSYPRVMGILRTKSKPDASPKISYVIGDAMEPRGPGSRIIAHVVNDKTPNWGRGFAFAVASRWPDAYEEFRRWSSSDKRNLKLGHFHISREFDGVTIFNMVAQHGYGPSSTPRIRYSALKLCLAELAQVASKSRASVHMPRIGTGYGMGSWSVIKELIDETLVRQGVSVIIYDLPGREEIPKRDLLEFSSITN